MRILVFGKNGQVAHALCNHAETNIDVIALGRDEADLLVSGTAKTAIQQHAPDVIINAAAYTAVDKAEDERAQATRLNCDAPAEMASAAKACNALFMHISTDYVFDGTAIDPLDELASVNPLNIYGSSKRDGEIRILEENPDAIILRTSWVFSDHGANFVKTMLKLAQTRNSLSVVADQIGGPTSAHDIAETLLSIAKQKHRDPASAGIYHYQGTPPVSWADFARNIFEQADLGVVVLPIPTKDYPTPATRPLNTILNCAKLEREFGIAQPDWRISLQRVIKSLKKQNNKERTP